MANEVSYGIIPLANRGGVWNVLLVKHKSGNHWSFPKGHPCSGESGKETAVRELKEETGLAVKRYLIDERFTEKYCFARGGNQVNKSVIYYMAEVEGDIFFQFDELSEGKWVPFDEAQSHITHLESQNLCRQALAAFEEISHGNFLKDRGLDESSS